jgi:hypothetical protein
MDEGKVFLTMLGVLAGVVVVFFVYNVFIKKALLKGKNIAGKAESILKKDMSSNCARSTFYMNNDYDNGYSQSEWMKIYKESVIEKEWDKDSEEYAEAVAPFINAIVVDDTGYYLRRGMENMAHTGAKFQPGVNDRISLNYFVEPYDYVEDKERAAKYAQAKTTRTVSYDSSASDLRKAEKAYRDAVYNHKRFLGGSLETYYEIQEKKAYAALLSAQAKYDSRK